MKNFKFEPFEEKHLEEALNIYNYYILNSTATFHINTISIEEMKDILISTDDRFPSFVIKDSDTICGYCLLAKYSPREAFDVTAEVTLYIKPEYTGCGLGTLSVNFLEDIAKKNNFVSTLSIICGENEASINLFKKCGYTEAGRYKDAGKKFGKLLDLVIYQKML
jgi:phosphinothricin acetyltransferase